jgi:tetratricopeptide (TPR) repeat protein
MRRIAELLAESSRRNWLIAGSLAVLAFVVFIPALDAKFVNFDDKDYVEENPGVTDGLSSTSIEWAFTTFHNANWHPLTWLSLQLDASLFGRGPQGFHRTNVLIHAVNTALLFLALRAFTGAVWRSAAVALLFGIHPLRVESVAWISERKDVLSAFFGLLALWAYAAYARGATTRRLTIVFLALTLSLLCKPMFVTLPFLCLVLDWWPLGRLAKRDPDVNEPDRASSARAAGVGVLSGSAKTGAAAKTVPSTMPPSATTKKIASAAPSGEEVRGWLRNNRQLVVEKLPLFILIAASAVVTYVAQKEGGAVGDTQKFPLTIRLENAAVSYVSYVAMTFWPVNLSPFYSHPGLPGEAMSIWKPVAAGLFLVVITATAIALRRRAPYLLAGWLWYVGTLVPVIGLVQVGHQAMADRYSYFPQIGLLLAACWGSADAVAFGGRAWRKAVLATFGLAASALAISTWIQAGYWHDSVSLWQHAILTTGANESVLLNCGSAIQDEGPRFYKDAAQWFERTLERYPNSAKALANLGYLVSEEGDQQKALDLIRRSLDIENSDPEVHSKLGIVLFRLGDYEGALREQQFAVDHQPQLHGAWAHLGEVEVKLAERDADTTRHLQRAADCYKKSLHLKPDAPEAHSVLGNILIRLNNEAEGFSHLQEAIRLDPEYADGHINLGKALAARGGMDAAAEQFLAAIRIKEKERSLNPSKAGDQSLALAWFNLGAARNYQGKFDDAVNCMMNAVDYDPREEKYGSYLKAYVEHLRSKMNYQLPGPLQDRLRRIESGDSATRASSPAPTR